MLQTDVSRPLSVLWDVGYYEIGYPTPDDDSDSNQERRKKRRREEGEHDEDDPYVGMVVPQASAYHIAYARFGVHQEEQFRAALHRAPKNGRSRSIHFTLKGGYKASLRIRVVIAAY